MSKQALTDGCNRGDEEFAPGAAEQALEAFDRRTFLKIMGAGMALAGGMAGCTKPQPLEKIVPYVDMPEGVIPGVPLFYASAIPASGWVSGFGRGVIVEQHEGRPTKIEGNPAHPSSLGGSDIFMQASVLQLYDPDRSKNPTRPLENQPADWGGVLDDLRTLIVGKGGAARVRIGLLTGSLTSPTLLWHMQSLRAIFPKLTWHVYDVVDSTDMREGQRRALGRTATPVYDFSKAARIVSLDAHFLADEPGSLVYARQFAHRRRLPFQALAANQTHASAADTAPPPRLTPEEMSRFYIAESTISHTGARADHRLAIKASALPAVARALLQAFADGGRASDALNKEAAAWVAAAAADLRAHARESLVVTGPYAPPEVHAAVCAMNQALGAMGNTLRLVEPVEGIPEGDSSLSALVQAMDLGQLDLLIILESNPAFTAPADLAFADALKRFTTSGKGLVLHSGGYLDETGALCHIHVPLSHPLESWGDVRGHDGTASLIQPLIQPLWQSRSAIEILAALAAIGLQSAPGAGGMHSSAADLYAEGYELLRRHWLEEWGKLDPGDREMQWRKSLRDGVVQGTASSEVTITQQPDLQKLIADLAAMERPDDHAIDLTFRPDPALGDGSWANQAWLQEMPRPLTRLTWDNAAIMSAQTAYDLGIKQTAHESRRSVPGARIHVGQRSVEMPVWIQPGHPDEAITLHIGNGRRAAGTVQHPPSGGGGGTDIYPLRRSGALWHVAGDAVRVEKIARRFTLACVQPTQWTSGREIVKTRPISELPHAAGRAPDLYSSETDAQGKTVHLSLYEERRYAGYKWGMVIDLSACIGCSACVVACQAENNIPCVGKDQVLRGREMHWMRIDTYYGAQETASLAQAASSPKSEIHFQPMACQHCEDAPCELVCPVEATSHSEEGINEMTYNRCIGTRYCSNNCPYKVRRFNFLLYNDHDQPTLSMQKNPNVTVRSRGVMEKCTYCIQRINRARIDAKRQWAQQDTNPLPHQEPIEMRTVEPDGWVDPTLLPRLRFQTACQQACPTEAIIFGDMNDTGSLVHRLKTQPPWSHLQFGVLLELNTQPRTSYLERLTNPNPALAAQARSAGFSLRDERQANARTANLASCDTGDKSGGGAA